MASELHQTILGAAESYGERIAHASSERPRSFAWTELSIYRIGPTVDASETFVAVIKGMSLREGEVERDRRKAFPTLARALGWGEFEHGSKLYDQLRNKAIAWMEERAREAARRFTPPPGLEEREAVPIDRGKPVRVHPPSVDSFIIQQNSIGNARRFVGVLLEEGGLEIVDGGDEVILHVRLVREIFGDDDA